MVFWFYFLFGEETFQSVTSNKPIISHGPHFSITTWKEIVLRWGQISCTMSAVRGTEENGLKLRQGQFQLDIRGKKILSRMVRHWNELSREVRSHHPWRCSRGIWICCWAMCFEGTVGSVGLIVGLDDLKGLFQPWWFYSMFLWTVTTLVTFAKCNVFKLCFKIVLQLVISRFSFWYWILALRQLHQYLESSKYLKWMIYPFLTLL